MFAVIFKATTKQLDNNYSDMVNNLRQLAFDRYHCIDFIAVTEGNEEIAISYWHTLDDIKQWKQDATHLMAQKLGQEKWYSHYRIQIVEIHKDYQFTTP